MIITYFYHLVNQCPNHFVHISLDEGNLVSAAPSHMYRNVQVMVKALDVDFIIATGWAVRDGYCTDAEVAMQWLAPESAVRKTVMAEIIDTISSYVAYAAQGEIEDRAKHIMACASEEEIKGLAATGLFADLARRHPFLRLLFSALAQCESAKVEFLSTLNEGHGDPDHVAYKNDDDDPFTPGYWCDHIGSAYLVSAHLDGIGLFSQVNNRRAALRMVDPLFELKPYYRLDYLGDVINMADVIVGSDPILAAARAIATDTTLAMEEIRVLVESLRTNISFALDAMTIEAPFPRNTNRGLPYPPRVSRPDEDATPVLDRGPTRRMNGERSRRPSRRPRR